MPRSPLDRAFARFTRSGDPDDLGTVFDAVAPELWRFAAYCLRDDHAVADVVQATFLKAIESAATWDRKRRVVPWLLGILAHEVRAVRRRRARAVPLAGDGPGRADDPAAVARASELRSEVEAALPYVAATYRDVVHEFVVHARTPSEIAARLGLRPGTARVRLHRGLEQLRRLLPAGFAVGVTALASLPGAAIAAVRSAVLAGAGAARPAAATTVATTLVTMATGVIVKKTLLMLSGAGLLGLAVLLGWQTFGVSRGGGAAGRAEPAALRARATVAPLARVSAPNEAATATRTRVAPAPSAKGRVRVRALHGETQAPLAGVCLEWFGRTVQRGTTDDDGTWTFDESPGKGRLALRCGFAAAAEEPPKTAVEVIADAETVVTLDLPVRLRASLRVVDEAARPVAGARVYATVTEGHVRWGEVGRTDLRGECAYASVLALPEIWVEADHFLSSDCVRLREGQSEVAPTIVLRSGAGELRGTLADARGTPMAGVLIAIQPAMQGDALLPPRPVLTHTDAHGAFATCSVPPGMVRVFALVDRKPDASGFLRPSRVARADVDVAIGARADVSLRLCCAQVVVRVRPPDASASGSATASARLTEAGIDGNLANELAGYAPFDEHGCARIAGLAPGRYALENRVLNRRATHELELAAGQTFEWSPVLPTAHDLRARLLDADGAALTGVWVGLYDMDGGTIGATAAPDPEGIWTWEGVADQSYDIVVGKLRSSEILDRFRDLRPRPEPWVLRVGGPRARARAHGRVVADGAALPADLVVRLLPVHPDAHAGEPPAVRVGADGTFALTNVAPGEYRAMVLAGGAAVADGGACTLTASSDVDLGGVHLRAAGGLRVRLVPFVPGARLYVLHDDVFVAPPQQRDGDDLVIDRIPAAAYELLVWGPDLAPARTRAIVTPEAAPAVLVATTPAVRCRIVREAASPVGGAGVSSIALRDAAGTVVRLHVFPDDKAFEAGLPPGRWTVDWNGARGTVETRSSVAVTELFVR